MVIINYKEHNHENFDKTWRRFPNISFAFVC